jgi:hypothetical protein
MSDIEKEQAQALKMIKAYVNARRPQDDRHPSDPGFMNSVRDQMVKDGVIDYFADGTINLTEKGKKWPGSLNTV